MYSLYRAWFGGPSGNENFVNAQDTLSPPDTVVRVGNDGEHHFVAHKGVLAAHSGYLKALLASSANATSADEQNADSSSASASTSSMRYPVTSVSVSSIGGEAFAPLLNYMYTGRLEVTLDNVYSVLLATHLLHMPGALEQCRAALLRLRAPPALPIPMPTMETGIPSSSGPGILRPIPNRLMVGAPLCWPQPPPLYSTVPTSLGISHLGQLQQTMMRSSVESAVSAMPSVQRNPEISRFSEQDNVRDSKIPAYQPQRSNRAKSRSPETTSSLGVAKIFSRSPSTSSTPSSPSSSPAPRDKCMETLSDRLNNTHYDRQSNSRGYSKIDKSSSKERESEKCSGEISQKKNCPSPPVRTESSDESFRTIDSDKHGSRRKSLKSVSGSCNETSSGNGSPSVVYDVACCDGPVRFHRVLNENYTTTSSPSTRVTRICEPSDSRVENDENGQPATNDLNGRSFVFESNVEARHRAPDRDSGVYTCGYCRHTFKSQYCYRKHAKRHLLPTQLNADGSRQQQRQDLTRNRREVRLLDLNVQYYPCKICGCKFPSYYFVHKHRKLCHSNLDEQTRNDEDSVQTNREFSKSPVQSTS